MSSSIEMDEGWRYTLLENERDSSSELYAECIGVKYTLPPKGYRVIRWKPVDQTDRTRSPLRFSTGDMELSIPIYRSHDLHEFSRIVIFGDFVNSCSCLMIPRTGPKTDPLIGFWSRVHKIMRTLAELEKKVRIWHSQCKHLMKRYQEAIDRVKRMNLEKLLDFSDSYLEFFDMDSQNTTCPRRASSPKLFVRHWNRISLDSWEWCEKRCRLVNSGFTNRLDTTEEDSLEADGRCQIADREALHSSLDLKLSISAGFSFFKLFNPATWFGWRTGAVIQGELESVWRRRLQASSCAPASFSPLDAYVIEDPDTNFVQDPRFQSRGGPTKSVQKFKWVGQTVAVSTISNISKVSAQAETGFLAKVQHPNVVELMGYAYKEELRDPTCYRECHLVTQYMECDLHDLITERLTRSDGTLSKRRLPFEFMTALDIALQIVEAMIHLHECRVIHRGLKPKNILASERYSGEAGTARYSIRTIDFGSSKSGDEGSHFDTRKRGTSAYMAPEVWESDDSYSWPADVYSFGLTCFEIFTGRLPVERGMARTHSNIQKVLRHGEFRCPFEYPEELKSLIVKCWAQNPSERPSFKDIRKDLWRLKVLCRSRYPCILDHGWRFMGKAPFLAHLTRFHRL